MSEQTEQKVGQSSEEAALEKAIAGIIPGIEDGTITWEALAKALRPDPEIVKAQSSVAVSRKITDAVKAKIARLPEVFGQVIPDAVRVLEPDEVEKLLVERDVSDYIVTELTSRKEDIRKTVLNHFDAKVMEEWCLAEDGQGFMCWSLKHEEGEHFFQYVPRNPDGHFVPETEGSKWVDPGTGDTGEQFSFERGTNKKADVSPSLLEALAKDEGFPFIDHKEYLAMTTQTRVFDPAKAMLAIKKNPKLIRAIAEATRPGSVAAALNIRKIK